MKPSYDDCVAILDSTAAMMRGMLFDPAMPEHAIEAMIHRIETIESLVISALYSAD